MTDRHKETVVPTEGFRDFPQLLRQNALWNLNYATTASSQIFTNLHMCL